MARVFGERLSDARRGGAARTALFVAREIAGAAGAGLRLRAGDALGRAGGSRLGAPAADLLQDVRFTVRSLRRAPAFALTAVGVLAVGIGANTAIFSAADAVLLKPLPFHEPERLVHLWEHNPERDWWQVDAAPANALDWRERVAAFEDVALYSPFAPGVTFLGAEGAEQVRYTEVTGNFFDVLGVRPVLGRGLTWEETWDAGSRPAVLAHDFWVSHFGGDPSVVGRSVDFAGVELEVVGVMPRDFRFPADETRLWIPFAWTREGRQQVSFRRAHYLRPVARLAPGVTFEQAEAELEAVARQLEAEYPETNRLMGAGMSPLHDFLAGDRGAPLLVLLGAVLVLLVLACANVGNLVLTRALGRGRELAVRRAMGAGGVRVGRLLLIEALLLAAAGGAVGVLLGHAALRLLAGLRPLGIPGVSAVALDGRVIAYAALVALVSALVFGGLPALRAARLDAGETLRDGGRAGSGRRSLRVTDALVVAELAMALVLVAGGGLLARSFVALRSVDGGFRSEGVMTFQLSVPSSRYPTPEDATGFMDRLLERLEALPDVERAALTRSAPLTVSWSSDFIAEGWEAGRAGFEVLHREVTPGYFEVFDVPLLAGRGFTDADRSSGERVVLINRTLAERFFPGEDPVGVRVAFDRAPSESSVWRRVVGVVGDERQAGLASEPRPEFFAPIHQDLTRAVVVALRTAGAPRAVMPGVRGVMTELDPYLPVVSERTMAEVMGESLARDRFLLVLLSAFAVSALVLATAGVYAVMAQAARRRAREIGIRMALGAGAPDVRRMVLRRGAVLAAAGVALGTAGALAAGRLLGGFLFGVAPGDPLTLVVVAALLSGTALAACWIPAERATRLDLVRSLSIE
jgi:putative ABC transport system permease protein